MLPAPSNNSSNNGALFSFNFNIEIVGDDFNLFIILLHRFGHSVIWDALWMRTRIQNVINIYLYTNQGNIVKRIFTKYGQIIDIL